MLYRPLVITQILSTQANYIDIKYGQMFYYTDQNQIWYDTQNKGRLQAYDIVILQYERERNNYIPSASEDFPSEPGYEIPSSYLDYVIVYVVETNCLYQYKNNIWTTIYGIYGATTVAQTYLPDGTVKIVYADDVTTNGILNDGSVVVRDSNKMICGQLQSDGYTFNIKSLIGGCINLDPSGQEVGNGCLQLTSNLLTTTSPSQQNNTASLNANLNIFGNISQFSLEDWYKQYRLVTENIEIISNTTIATGSLLKAGSSLDDTQYENDTVLTEDVSATSGMIVQSSKLYKNSIINNQTLKPPFLFDIDNVTNSILPATTSTDDVTITNNIMQLNNVPSFKNNGDTCYVYSNNISDTITQIKIGDITYDIEYMSKEGISNSARIIYYVNTNTVKVLP